MAKRKCDIAVTHDPEDPPYSYTLWVDDPKIASKIKDIGGVIDMCDSCANKGPGWVWIDARYDAREVIAEIKALADGKEPCKGDTLDSLEAEARDLGQRAADAHKALPTGRAYLEAADRVHGEECGPITRKWLGAIRDYVDSLCEKRGVDPQPEPSLAEAARALGQKAGAAGIPFTVAKQFLEAAEKTYGKSYPEVLPGIIRIIAERIEFGHWC